MDGKQYLNLLFDQVEERTREYLRDEIGMEVLSVRRRVEDVRRLGLRYLTSLLAVGGDLEVYLAFTFDESLIRKICEIYTRDLEPAEDDDVYLSETAGDMINVIVGNSLSVMSDKCPAVSLSPPVFIREGKLLTKRRHARFLMLRLLLDSGEMSIFCIGPKEIFDEQLNYRES